MNKTLTNPSKFKLSKRKSIRLKDYFDSNKLARFTLHTITMMIFTSIYGVVDGLFISNIVGSNAFASINLIMSAIMMVAQSAL